VLEDRLRHHSRSNAVTRLSPRETEVLSVASEGLTNEQIAARLNVTAHAVKFHLSSVYRKLGVQNRTEAVVEFLRVGTQAR
jgi:DNA-binding CsgD family transcriptional regulator